MDTGNPYSPGVFVYVFVFVGVFVLSQRIYVSDRILGKPVQMHRRPARRFHQGSVACDQLIMIMITISIIIIIMMVVVVLKN